MTGISILDVFRQRLPADSALRGKIENYYAHPESYPAMRDLGLEMVRHTPLVIAAEPFLARALSQSPTDGDRTNLLAALGVAFTFRAHFEGAIQVFSALAKVDAGYVYELADVLFRDGRFDEAARTQGQLVDSSYAIAESRAKTRGEPITQLMSPARLVCIRYGEMANKLDMYVKARALGLVPPVRALLTAPAEQVVNQCYLNYWREQAGDFFTIVSDPTEIAAAVQAHTGCAHHLDFVRLPSGRVEFREMAYPVIQKAWDDQGRPPVLTLTAEHQARGRAALKRLGVPEDAWFVCLHVRESSSHGENVPWNPNAHRNADIATYDGAIAAVVERGGYVIRMGDPSMKTLAPMANVIDFAHRGDDVRTDWMDVFLLASARFIIGMSSGPPFVGWTFGVPIIGTNWFPLGYWPFAERDIFVPKLLRNRDGRFLTIRESVARPIAGTPHPSFYTARGLEVIDNRPEDITAATLEMMDRLEGRPYSDDDERQQQQFRERAAFDSLIINARIGRAFLQDHPFLIQD